MKDWIKKHLRELVIAAVVLAGHFIFILTNFKTSHTLPASKQSIVVHTHVQPRPHEPSKPTPMQKKKNSPPVRKKGQNILKEVQETLATIEQKQVFVQAETSLSLPKQIQKLQIDEMLEGNSSYLSLLVLTLREKLKLPEAGRVRIQMTVLKSGRVEKVQVLYAESENNRHYLEQALAYLVLPPFSDELAGKLRHTFTLNFCHEN